MRKKRDPLKQREANRRHYQKNSEAMRERARKYREANKTFPRVKVKDPEIAKASHRQWLATNKDKVSAYSRERWKRKTDSIDLVSPRFCRACLTEKPCSEFYPTYLTKCRECLKAKRPSVVKAGKVSARGWRDPKPPRVRKPDSYYREAARMYIRNNPEIAKRNAERSAKWARENAGRVQAKVARRRAMKLQATPSWADQQAIRRFYDRARRLTETTGIQHEVDHIVPLRSPVVCGLHCEANLQILTKRENRRKWNHHEAAA